MIVLVGESASGKTTLANMLVEKYPEYKKIVTYTTRPKRENEVDGVDYHFISEERFAELVTENFFIEHAKYRDWSYGTAKEDCVNDETAVAVLTPAGLRKLKSIKEDIQSIYLYVDRRSRLLMILVRGDDIDEAYRRNLSDVGQFDGIIDEVDYIIDNSDFHMTPEQTLKCLATILQGVEVNDEDV